MQPTSTTTRTPTQAPNPVRNPAPGLASAWTNYMTDAFQRSVLFLELLRRRGNAQIDITAHPTATVLRFQHELVMSGHTLKRPMNYALLRILPPPGVITDPRKRPVVVIDPRAGQGPGIGGFKAESEIGDALNAEHPVYFIGFAAEPEPGQQFLDVVEGQVAFFERIVALHPGAPRPFAIGNCQAGYQTLMVAMLRPDLFGPCLVAGSPMSYWQGVRGKNPMRYGGGLLGGSWLTELTSDLGHGKFDGTGLVLNFDNLGPANWLWGKQYGLYTTIDTGGERYLDFEKWWGDFIELNGDELQFLVDNLFIGDKLTRNQLASTSGKIFDLRTVASPIIVFASEGDNISPPPQALGWIADLYRNVDDIRAAGQTIVYCLSQTLGHLAIFVSTKVGAEQDEEFVQMIDVIDCLPPGLHEMIISPRPDDVPRGGFFTGDWIARFEPRTVDDIRALGRNGEDDDRAFAAVACLSERNLAAYRLMIQPLVRALVTQPMADLARAVNPLRLSYTMFADSNPWMKLVTPLADAAAASRRKLAADNPFLALQTQASNQIIASLNAYQTARDAMMERMFFGFYGSPVVQAMLGLGAEAGKRPPLALSPAQQEGRRTRAAEDAAKLNTGGYDAALTRAVMYVLAGDRVFDQRCALALNAARQQTLRLTLDAFKLLVRDQCFLLQHEPGAALAALASMVPDAKPRRELLDQVAAITGAAGKPDAAQRDRLTRLSEVLPIPQAPPARAAARADRNELAPTV